MHRKPSGLTQIINISSSDQNGLCCWVASIPEQNDSIWLLWIDWKNLLSLSSLILLIWKKSMLDCTSIRLWGCVVFIWIDVSNTLVFGELFKKGLGTQVKLRTAFHPQMDCEAERIIQTLEHMLIACVLNFKESWDDHYRWYSSLIIIATIRVSPWHLLKHFT